MTPINKYVVLDPKGVVWDGKVVGKGGEIVSTEDGRIRGYLHFKQIKNVAHVADVAAATGIPGGTVGDPAVGRETLAPITDRATGDLVGAAPLPERPDVTARPAADGGVTAKVHQPAGTAIAPGAVANPTGAKPLPVFEELAYPDLRAWAVENNIELAEGRSQEAILGAIRKVHPLVPLAK